MKFFKAFVLVCTLSVMSEASEVKKVFDGTRAYCPEISKSKYLENDIVIETSIQRDQLQVQAKTCVDGKWQKVSDLKNRHYQTFDGINVSEHYDGFTLVVQSLDLKITKRIELVNFEELSSFQIELKELQEVDPHYVDINLMSARLTQTNQGYSASDDVSWGSSRLFFK